MGQKHFKFSRWRQLKSILKQKKLYTLCVFLILAAASVRLGVTLAQGYAYALTDNVYVHIAIIFAFVTIGTYSIIETFRIGKYIRRTKGCKLTRHKDYSVTFICTEFSGFNPDTEIMSEWHMSDIKAVLKTKEGYKLYGEGVYIPNKLYRKTYQKINHLVIPEWFDNMDVLKKDLVAAIKYADAQKKKRMAKNDLVKGKMAKNGTLRLF